MKKSIIKRLLKIILVSMLVSLVLNYYIQVQMKYRDMSEGARKTFLQVRRIIDENKKESERIKVDFAQNCLIRAKAAAYCVQYHPEMLEDQMEMKKVASILQIDEFHIFDKEGNLYAGSEPKYFGMNFNSGEQMQFFLPMLKDTTLELCQDITPNTAEAKMMQYAAVWREDKKEIIQIGMEPARVLEAMEKTRLSYIFSLVAVDSGADIYAISEENGKVSGSTSGMQVGMDARELGFDLDKAVKNEKVYSMVIGGQRKCCVFENKDSLILVKTFDRGSIFEGINKNIGLLVLYLVLMICFILYFIVRYLDKYIIQSVYGINEKLQAITEGDLMIELGSQPTPELTKLSTHVNDMVKSILSTTNKLSIVLDTVKLPLGVYEYAPGMKQVMVTSRMRELLGLTEQEAEILFADAELFRMKLDEIRSNPVNEDKTVFLISGENDRYLRIESFEYEKSTLGIVLDTTREENEKRSIERERDIDLLTELYTRRAFYKRLDMLFQAEDELKHAALIMLDADNLKRVNDVHGHENGDRYLRAIADVLKQGSAQKIAARLSGDEFVVFLFGYEEKEVLEQAIEYLLAERDVKCVELKDGTSITIGFSAGCVFYPEEGTELIRMMKRADERMYEEKKRRKGKPA